ncbi:hypothetical protein IscW_ISCW011307 [Ixodes scapularis]|uniref:Uncharacterized protein n=1 Tax=Ixodes scapularis TaxID=6945 RepID=B7Q863_IXOSC|nr:hypothetical protein IscW_ISCW011307 [Ixodes scapularis]|eukprot:XP_002412297.1 hypothetical protein IscW_ISCW011307 [Ixodes scapularis]
MALPLMPSSQTWAQGTRAFGGNLSLLPQSLARSVSCTCLCAGGSDRKLYFLADAPHTLKNLRGHLVQGQHVVIPDEIVTEAQPSIKRGTFAILSVIISHNLCSKNHLRV